MTSNKITGSFRVKSGLSKITGLFEKASTFIGKPENEIHENFQQGFQEIGSERDLENNPYLTGMSKTAYELSNSRFTDIPLLQLRNVWKIYEMGEIEFAALKGINLEIYEGEFLVVLGPSGSGKSTLMNLLGCLDLPSKGNVYLNSKDISELDESELALIRGKMIGFIFQNFNLIPTLNTEENILLPLEFQEENPQLARQKTSFLLEIVGLSDKKNNLPSQLSGGQRQRVAIARSLAANPPIILADEPTGNLDTKTGDYILEFLNKLHEKEGKTIIIVTHDLDIVKYATRVVYIRDGEIEKIEQQKK